MKKNNLGLYLHIPFCVKKCLYCDFLSSPADSKMYHEYSEMLVKEMKIWKEKVSAKMVDTIFIGGGTPSILEPEDMEIILSGMQENFSLSNLKEFTIECNPGTVSKEKLELYRQYGVNRLSFGMQSTMDDELKQLGRIHTYEEFLQSYELARNVGFDNINIDIMSAIPRQTLESYKTTLQRVTKLKPEHISSYSLIIEEGTPFFAKYAENPPVNEEDDRRMYEMTEEILSVGGYDRYEISNYSLEGKECKHNVKYWTREEYLGLGLGAASLLDECRFSNVTEMTDYFLRIQAGKSPVTEKEELSVADAKAEFMYLGLRRMKGISINEFECLFGEKLEECYGEEIQRCEKRGLLARENDRIFLTNRGIDVSNRVFQEFI